MSTPTTFDVAGDILTRLTLDTRAAFVHATDAATREYAFGLAHLTRDITEMLTAAAWIGCDPAALRVMETLAHRVDNAPATVPDWLRILIRSHTNAAL